MRKLRRRTSHKCSAIAYASRDQYKITYKGNRPPPDKLEPGKCSEMDAVLEICDEEKQRPKHLEAWIRLRRSRLDTKERIERRIREIAKAAKAAVYVILVCYGVGY